MKKALLPLLAFVLLSQLVTAQSVTKNYEFRNGNWFNGTTFVSGTWYTSKGLLTRKAPSKVDSVIDLQQRWVVPPMGDASCASMADNSSAANTAKMYFDEGVFYLQIIGNTQEGRAAVLPVLNKPNTPDGTFSNGALTCTLGYPFTHFEGPANGIKGQQKIAERYDFIKQQRKMLGNGYWFIDSKEMLDQNWDKIKAQKPGFIYIYLLNTEANGGKESGGLTADAAKAIVKKAHKSNLRVIATTFTAADLRLGLKLDVDGFTLPGYSWDGSGDSTRFELNEDDLKKLAKKKTPVTPLFAHAQASGPVVQRWQARQLNRLFNSGVNVVIGSDDPQRTIRAELNYWCSFPTLNAPAVLKVLCENTPRAIFPNRKIGKLDEGYEANFLVLSDNPLQNLLKIRLSTLKVKGGSLNP
ncbi:MAG: hypothetical protein ABIQ93_11825 [Saprospiraceae bacterium]